MGQMFSRMQWRIAIPYTLLIGACLFGLSAYLAAVLSQAQVEGMRTRLSAEARLVTEVVLPTLLSAGGDDLNAEQAAQLKAQVARLSQRTDARITIVDERGVVLADTIADPATMENHAGRPEIASALAGGGEASSVTRRSATIGDTELYVATPVLGTNNTILGVARLAVPLNAVNDAIRQIMLVVAVALLAAIGIAVGLALWIAGYVTGPLRKLTTVADEVARGSPLAMLGVAPEGEIGRLAEAFNQMADQLKAQMLSLAHERDVLASVLTNMTDGIVVVDHESRVVIANEAARRLLDMIEAPEGLSLARAVRDHEICAALDEALAHGTRRTEVRRAGNSHLRVAAAPLRESAGGLLVLRDVTEERRVENLRRDFVANVSHELRTPIAALKALVETLEDGALDDPPAARDFLRRIHVEVDGLAQLVAELLELSRVESGRAQLKLEAVEPDELVSSAAERLRAHAERVGLALTWDADPELAPVLADRTRVEHVLLALVHNAIKFTPPGGLVRVNVVSDGSFAHFTVEDTGSGIPAEDVPRIFERFYKVDRARAAVGTGLGLAIAKHVIQALGGRIWAESEVDRGTTVHFTLPTATAETGGHRASLAARF
jgi:two-component system phosphate regulon sensor histidine kinase PhoR